MSKKLKVVLTYVLACALVSLGLGACALFQSDESKAKSAVQQSISQLSSTNDEALEEILGHQFVELATAAEVDPSDITRALFANLKTDVTNTTIDDLVANCEVAVTNIDIPTALKNYRSRLQEWTTSADLSTLISEGGNEALTREILNMLVDNLKNDELEKTTQTVTVDLIKDADGSWNVENQDALLYAMLMGADVSSLF